MDAVFSFHVARKTFPTDTLHAVRGRGNNAAGHLSSSDRRREVLTEPVGADDPVPSRFCPSGRSIFLIFGPRQDWLILVTDGFR